MKFLHSFFMSLVLLAMSMNQSFAQSAFVNSPDGKIQFRYGLLNGQLIYSVRLNNKTVVETGPITMTINGESVTNPVSIQNQKKYKVNETYPWHGVHSLATNNFNGLEVEIKNRTSGLNYTLDIRVFNNGASFRMALPGAVSIKRTPDEATEFNMPAGSTVWYHDLNGHYESIYSKKAISEIKANEWAGPPLSYKLPGNIGYVAITEADLKNYSGMALQANGKRGFILRLAHNHPTSYPYKLRYSAEDTLRLRQPATVTGAITTPWRVIMVGADLNTMLNNDMVHNLCPAPDKTLFPKGINTDWIKPGRAVWKYLDSPSEESTLEVLKEFSKNAGELGFEHNILEGFWSRWTDEQIRDLISYSKERSVGIWFWKHSKSLWNAEERRAFFKRCQDLGVAGVKLDFFDHEHKEVIDFYQTILRETAEHKLMVDFHGSTKPTGESRTWPNELTRESVKGMETRNIADRATHHTTIPFTRWLAGPAEYTPVHFAEERRRNTSWTHQIASAAILSAPLLTYSANPKTLLASPAVEMIKSIPSVWDETIALPPSEIGEAVVMARRKGDTWFLIAINGAQKRSFSIPLSFLNKGPYTIFNLKDDPLDAANVVVENGVKDNSDTIQLNLQGGGGYIARFSKK